MKKIENQRTIENIIQATHSFFKISNKVVKLLLANSINTREQNYQ